MMNLESLQNAILVAPKEYRTLLFLYKNKHPELSFKILSKDDLLNLLSYSFTEDPIPFLLQAGVSYGNAKQVLSLIRIADVSSNAKLSDWVKKLSEAKLLKEDPLGKEELKGRRIFLLESEEDSELSSFLERKGVSFSFLSLDDLGVEKEGEKGWAVRGQTKKGEDIIAPKIVYFPNKFYQYLYILSDIRRRIIDDPSLKGDFVVLCHDDSDAIFAQSVSELLQLPICFQTSSPYLSNPKIKEKTSYFHAQKSFAFTEEELDDPELKAYHDLIEHYGLEKLEFSFAYANLLEILSSLRGVKEKTPGVLITSRLDFDPRKIVYVACFQHGDFYRVYSDKSVLNDKELASCGANPSYVKTTLDRRLKLNYLRYSRIALLSRPLQHLTDKIHDSGFVGEFNWGGAIKKSKWNLDGCYTQQADKIRKADYLDSLFCRKATDGLLDYDHSFKNDGTVHLKKQSKYYSVTNLERYISCPFAHLLNSYFPNDPSSVRVTQLGTLNHAMMAPIYEEEYDFDALFAENEKEYWKAFESNKVVPTEEDKAVLSIYKKWLRYAVAAIREQKDCQETTKKNKKGAEVTTSVGGMAFPLEKPERGVGFTLKDEDGRTYPFYGRIDKILFTGSSSSRYYTIIDYKSGKEEFNGRAVFLGPSIQLPLYYKALQQENNISLLNEEIGGGDVSFGGFLIQHSFFSDPSSFASNKQKVFTYSELAKKVLGKGLTTTETSYYDGIDPLAFGDKNKITCTKSKFIKKGLFFDSAEGEADIFGKEDGTYSFSKLVTDAENAAISTIKKIEAGEFPIAPTSSDLKGTPGALHCLYCPYDDICYKNKAKDAVSYAEMMVAHFKDEDADKEVSDDEQKQ